MNTKKRAPLTREEWLNKCAVLILDEVIRPVWDVREELEIKVSVGYPPNSRTNGRTIGVCLASDCSEHKYNEIFISPVAHDSIHVLGILAHELAHAVDDCKHGHKGPFVKLIRKMGLVGKPTSTMPGKILTRHLERYVKKLGPMPHARVDLSSRPSDVNRNVKVVCPKCNFKFNTSRTQIRHVLTRANEVKCPACATPMDYPEIITD